MTEGTRVVSEDRVKDDVEVGVSKPDDLMIFSLIAITEGGEAHLD